MEKLKELFNKKRVTEISAQMRRAWKEFPEDSFLKQTIPMLPSLELKGRVKLIAEAYRQTLPSEYRKALKILLGSLRSEKNLSGISGFQAWPALQFVESFGLDFPEESLEALKEMTPTMSAEFAIRPFLQQAQDLAMKKLCAWSKDPNPHVRRLVSEGTRPRLPWAGRLPAFQNDPTICLPLLKTLRTDPELYVRKSVANHLNDFSKDHPDWLVKELKQWKKELPDHQGVAWIIRHSLRSLIKAGHPGALELIGYRPALVQSARVSLSSKTIAMGGQLEITLTAVPGRSEKWLIDYAIHHRKKDGSLSPKVFKWTEKTVNSGRSESFKKTHRFVPITTRVYYSGEHLVEIFINGASAGRKKFHLSLK